VGEWGSRVGIPQQPANLSPFTAYCLLPTAYCLLIHFSAEFNDFVEFSDCSVDNCCKEFSGAGRFAREIALVEVV